LILYVQSLATSTVTESNKPATQERLSEDHELMGDAAAGRALFFGSSSEPGCIVCHSIGGHGGKIAPDLSEIAAKPAKEILQSISEPNANVDGKYSTLELTLKNGNRFTGVKRDEDAATIRLYDTSSLPPISRSFLKTDIAKIETLKTSAMPADYTTKLSRKQLLDLVGFLKTGESAK
jgi:putative heme-binding domain-containing protein